MEAERRGRCQADRLPVPPNGVMAGNASIENACERALAVLRAHVTKRKRMILSASKVTKESTAQGATGAVVEAFRTGVISS